MTGAVPLSGLTALSPLDEAIHHLDSPGEPWSIQLEARVDGVLDETRLRSAVDAALRHHARARARLVARGRVRRASWEVASQLDVDPVDVVTCADDAELAAAREDLYQQAVPLTTSPPLRVRLAHHGDGDVVMVNVNHAAADGVAALAVLRSIATVYSGQTLDEADLPVEAVAIRAATGWSWVRTLLGELRGAAVRSTHLAPEGGHDGGGYGFHHRSLTADQTNAVVERAKGGPTVNDLLLAALHRSIERWNFEHHVPADRVGVLVPVNLRPRSSWYQSVGNFSFLVPVATHRHERVEPTTTLDAVQGRTRHVKERLSAASVVKLLSRLSFLPLPVRHRLVDVTARPKVMPTAILSNLGRLPQDLHLGARRVVEVWFSPPTKMPLGLGVGAVTAGGRLHLAFRYRHPLFGPAEAARFADELVEALVELVAAPGRRDLQPLGA